VLTRRLGLSAGDGPYLAGGFALLLGAAYLSTIVGAELSLGALAVLVVLLLVVASFVAVPHWAVAVTIPVFALLPVVKVLALPWLGPLKDLITIGAILASLLLVIQRSATGERIRGDAWACGLALLLIGLYISNLGGRLERDAAWLHGMRLNALPLMLLVAGMTLPNPRRTLRWAVASLIATSVLVAVVGIAQQTVSVGQLNDLGFEYDLQIRTIDGRLRSFGTLDDPFAYAALLMFAFAAVLMWMRRGTLAFAVGGIIAAGLTVSYVRSAIIIAFALLAVWLARKRQTTVSFFLMLFAAVVAGFLLVRSSEATESRTVRAGPNFFLTVNGRTDAWSIILDKPSSMPFGQGVGEVGTAADRATYTVSRSAEDARASEGAIVDSSYFATIADIGVIGLALLVALFGRLLVLALRAERAGSKAGALALGLLTVMILDPLARESLTGFPTAFLGFLLLGLATAAATEETAEPSDEPAVYNRPPPEPGRRRSNRPRHAGAA
jgi:O-antigen ligase